LFPFRRFLSVSFKLAPILVPYYIYRKTHKGKDPTPAERRKLEKQGKALFEALVSLGPSFIKLGQLLSVRPDILPQEYLKELEKLQDEVPPAPFEQVESLIRSELGSIEKIFEKFEKEPIASASLGQVYKAIYRGMQVAVKVNRPNIKKSCGRRPCGVRRFAQNFWFVSRQKFVKKLGSCGGRVQKHTCLTKWITSKKRETWS